MAARLKNLDRNTPMLLPPDLRDWVPANHMVHFLLDAINALPEDAFHFNHRGTGSSQYPPRMMLLLLIYSYATGRFSSREIEAATHSDVIVRYICGGDLNPDHDTICTFRRKNRALFERAFVEVLLMAREIGGLQKVGSVSIDGTKIKANASKHAAVSYKRAGDQIELLQQEVAALTAKAEAIDNTPLDDGLSSPGEIVRREDRIARLKEARRMIETRHKAVCEAKKKECKQARDNGKKTRGKGPKPSSKNPPDKMQHNFTDPESRIMKAGNGSHFEQCYNAQAAVDNETYLIVGQLVTDAPNDKQQLNPVIQRIAPSVATPAMVLADTAYFSEKAVKQAELNHQLKVLCAIEKTGHHRSVEDLEKQPSVPDPDPAKTIKEQMKQRLKQAQYRCCYNLRKQTV